MKCHYIYERFLFVLTLQLRNNCNWLIWRLTTWRFFSSVRLKRIRIGLSEQLINSTDRSCGACTCCSRRNKYGRLARLCQKRLHFFLLFLTVTIRICRARGSSTTTSFEAALVNARICLARQAWHRQLCPYLGLSHWTTETRRAENQFRDQEQSRKVKKTLLIFVVFVINSYHLRTEQRNITK